MENKQSFPSPISERKKIYIFALAAYGKGISGSDRIFIEFARRWSKKVPVTIYVWEEGYKMYIRHKLQVSKIKFQISRMEKWKKLGFITNYIARIVEGIRIGLTLKLETPGKVIVYSASEFWMDSIPAAILKMRYHKIRWAAAWYQTAPLPWVGFSEGVRKDRYYFKSIIYWLVQLPIKPLIAKLADFVLINNDLEKKQFPKQVRKNKAIVVLGAVDWQKIGNWKSKNRNLPKIYDAIFQGRFHPQKGVVEIIDIWKLVVDKLPKAKLVMIGDGPLMEKVKGKVKREKLENNIKLTGYLFDGEEKYSIFSQTKIVVHPSFYDSGGMAALEAMAFGLPCVGFNLPAFKDYFPEGMIKVRNGDLENFANKILKLLKDGKFYKKLQKETRQLVSLEWSWQYRSRQILNQMLE